MPRPSFSTQLLTLWIPIAVLCGLLSVAVWLMLSSAQRARCGREAADHIDCGADFKKQVFVQESLYGHNEGAKRAIADLNRLRTVYSDAYKSGNYADFKVFGVTLDSVLPFVASGAFLPEFDFNGNPIQVLGTESDVDGVAFNVTVLGNVTVGVLGWWGQPDGPAHRFVDSFASLLDKDKATALATCAFEYLENLYLRESWWNSL
jgi:hypothetical protein